MVPAKGRLSCCCNRKIRQQCKFKLPPFTLTLTKVLLTQCHLRNALLVHFFPIWMFSPTENHGDLLQCIFVIKDSFITQDSMKTCREGNTANLLHVLGTSKTCVPVSPCFKHVERTSISCYMQRLLGPMDITQVHVRKTCKYLLGSLV